MSSGDSQKPGSEQSRSWWSFLAKYWTGRTAAGRESQAVGVTTSPVDDCEELPYCPHGRIRKALAGLTGKLLRRPRNRSTIEGLCPICGLLPQGDRKVAYVLKVWFADGEVYEYEFRHRSWKDCHRIIDNALHIYLEDSVLTYSMDFVSALTFGPREVLPESPEVSEAERIIAGKRQPH